MDLSDAVLGQAAAQAESFRNVFRSPSEPAPEGAWQRFAAALDDDFSTPGALAVMHEWRDHELLTKALGVFGLASLGEQAEAPPAAIELAERREEARARRDFEEADRLRGEIAALGWEVRDVTDGFQLIPL
jgi:cysteinyl-tRNA synthetase